MSRQKMGQHFLRDLGWRKRILATLPSASRETWIEVGAGHGEMTELLAGIAKRVIAIEGDAELAAQLRERVSADPAAWPGVEVVSGDVLAQDFAKLAGDGRFHVYGNLPYYITSPILHHLFGSEKRIESIHIVIQREVAERIVAQPGRRDYGYLSVLCQFYSAPRIALRLPPGAFRPPPKVESALVAMTLPRERASLRVGSAAGEHGLMEFVQACFRQKRKTLRNNLKTVTTEAKISSALAEAGLRPDARAEQLSLRQFVALFEKIGV